MQALLALRFSDHQIARLTGVPRTTVLRWRRTPPSAEPPSDVPWRPPDPVVYAYVLGLYLGDGHVSLAGRSGTLTMSLDGKYPRLNAAVERALEMTFPGSRVHARLHTEARLVRIVVSTPRTLGAFPQHGPGKKHHRLIALEPWQRAITEAYPEHLVRGLLHSDGCRTVNRFQTRLPSGRVATYAYPRYFFSNLSADIRGIFCEHCELLGLRWTQSNPRNISIAHRDSVALLDQFVGPKA